MDYELAKELKDAGFPNIQLPKCSLGISLGNPQHIYSGMCVDTFPIYPSLSELIEACGNVYTEDGKKYEFGLMFSIDKWFASFFDGDFNGPKLPNGEGKTREEAVARLYLQLKRGNIIK